MTATRTATATYTRVDVAKVFEIFAAELRVIARTTGCWTDDRALQIAGDVALFAAEDYLHEAHVVLADASGATLRAHVYTPSTDASGWAAQGPAGNVWPPTPGGSLTVVVAYNARWRGEAPGAQAALRARLALAWGPSNVDTTHAGLTAGDARAYASNAYGLRRNTLTRP